VQRKKNNSLKEGNLYNIEDQIVGRENPTEYGISQWKKEVIQQLYGQLQRNNIPNIDQIFKSVFGESLK
jgi:hypothetical protein